MIAKKLVIDLCAGKEGFSQAFRNDPDYEVVTLDIEKKFKPTIVADVRHLPLKQNLQPDLLLAGPPCERFSIAMPTWPKMGIQLAMQIVGAVFEAVPYLQPKQYLIENPMGRLRWFLGTPKKSIRYSDYDLNYKAQKRTDMWGTLPLPMAKAMRNYNHKSIPFDYIISRNPAERAKAPAGVSAAIKEGLEVLC
jgi:site-specific DNA-cytosine methylase